MIARVDEFTKRQIASTSLTFNGVRLSTRTVPAQGAPCGGDWCEAFVLSDDVVALSIGDVCGHGVGTFQQMVAIRRAIREAAYRRLDPAQTLAEATRLLGLDHQGLYATAIFALLDSRRRTVSLANAGHPSPLVAGPRGSYFLEFPAKDRPLGLALGLLRKVRVVKIPADTLLVFYTDGVTERERDVLRGEAQLRDAALFAYQCRHLPSASVIERQMFLMGSNRDDAAILTAWTPPARVATIPAPQPLAPAVNC